MAVVVLVKQEVPIRHEVEETLDCLQILNLSVEAACVQVGVGIGAGRSS